MSYSRERARQKLQGFYETTLGCHTPFLLTYFVVYNWVTKSNPQSRTEELGCSFGGKSVEELVNIFLNYHKVEYLYNKWLKCLNVGSENQRWCAWVS